MRVNLAEVEKACCRCSTTTKYSEAGLNQRSILAILMEIVTTARDMIAKLPYAVTTDNTSAEERVKVSGYTWRCTIRPKAVISYWNQRASDTAKDVTGTGDYKLQERQVRFKGTPAVVHIVPLTRQRTTEDDRGRMKLGVSIRPARLVGLAVK